MGQDPNWVPWSAGKWIVGTMTLSRDAEYVFFRLIQKAYEGWSDRIPDRDRANANFCKMTLAEYAEACQELKDGGKIVCEGGEILIPSVTKRVRDVDDRLKGQRDRAEAAREAKRQKLAGVNVNADGSSDLKADTGLDNTENTEKRQDTQEREDTETDKGAVLEVSEAFSLYNEMAGRVEGVQCQSINATRKAKMRQRLDEVDGLNGWRMALAKAEASSYLRGEKNDFRIHIDFLLQAKSFTKLMEGAYDDAVPGKGKSPASLFEVGMRQAREGGE